MSTTPDPTEPPAVFLVTAKGGMGLTAAQVRAKRFVAPSRGVRVHRDEATDTALILAAALAPTPERTVLSDIAAAAAWDLPLPPWIALHLDEHPVSLAVPAKTSRPQRTGTRGRRLLLPDEHLTTHRGVRLTTAARTWLDCAACIPPIHLVVLGDAVLARGLATADELIGMTRWARRRRGVVAARHVVPLLDGRSASPGESMVRFHLLEGGVRRPLCNLDIVVDGQWLARADLAWEDERVIVEYDGLVHLDERQRRRDAARRNLLQDAGWQVITFTADDLGRPHSMVALVSAALSERQPRR